MLAVCCVALSTLTIKQAVPLNVNADVKNGNTPSHAINANVFAALRWPPKKNLIINREVSGGYCKTAVSRWTFSQTTIKWKIKI